MLQYIKEGAYIDGTYLVKGLLGSGGSSTVYIARDPDLNRDLAIKVLSQDMGESYYISRIKREAKVLSQLSHPNIVKVFRVGIIDESRPYIAMELIHGKSLRAKLDKDKNLSCQEAVEIALQICSALNYAHSMQVIHRDLKPENVVFDEDFSELRIKLIDFGLCKIEVPAGATNTLTQTGTMLGTALYMSPEQCLAKEIDKRTDIYSFGCVLYEMLTGRPPFVAETPAAVLVKHLSSPLPIILELDPGCGLPQQLQDLLEKCTAKQKENRYESFEEIAGALHEIEKLNCIKKFDPRRASLAPRCKNRLTVSGKMLKSLLIISVIAISGSAFWLIETGNGATFLCKELQAGCSASLATELLVSVVGRLASSGKVEDASKVIEATMDSQAYLRWTELERCRLLSSYIEKYRQLHMDNQVFSLRLLLLEEMVKFGRTQGRENLKKADKQPINKVCDELLSTDHTKDEWLKITRTIQRADPNGETLSPYGLKLMLLFFWSKTRNEVAAADVAQVLKVALAAMKSASSENNEQLLQKIAGTALKISETNSLPASAAAIHTNLGSYYYAAGRLDKAKSELRLAETFAQKGFYMPDQEARQLESLSQSCRTGHYVPAERQEPVLARDKAMYEKFIHGGHF